MYTESSWLIPDDMQAGLFGDGKNPLWSGSPGPVGLLKVPDYEIGVHTIGMTIVAPDKNLSESLSILLVTKVPLASVLTSAHDKNQMLADMTSKPVQDWVPELMADILNDHTLNTQFLYDPYLSANAPTPSAPGYTCPLKRFAFYGRNNSLFHPVFPHPVKSRFMFARITHSSFAHPTMTQVSGKIFILQCKN